MQAASHHQSIRTEDDHQAASDGAPKGDAAVGKHDDDPASREEKETRIAHIVKPKGKAGCCQRLGSVLTKLCFKTPLYLIQSPHCIADIALKLVIVLLAESQFSF
jgi:hypothetical protein